MGCTLKPASNFSIAHTVCKKVEKYGDAFSKSSSIFGTIVAGGVYGSCVKSQGQHDWIQVLLWLVKRILLTRFDVGGSCFGHWFSKASRCQQ